MTVDRARAVLLGLVGGLAVSLCVFSPAELSSGRFWSDGATYYAAALSLARDGDLRYEAKDVERVRREYLGGPQGIFLKRASGGLRCDAAAGFPWIRRVRDDEKRVYFAKAFAYPVVAAPLVWLIGGRGLILTNVLLFGLALVLCFEELRRQTGPGRALAVALVLFFGTVTPVYVVWLTPEIMNVALVTAGLVAWRRERPLLSAVLLGIVTYSKYSNVLLAIPLGLMPFLETPRRWPDLLAPRFRLRALFDGPRGRSVALRAAPLLTRLGEGWRGRFLARLAESLRRGLVLGATTAVLFGLTALITGEVNYQGGERKTFYGFQLPFEGRATFGNCGEWMTTNQFGPKVEGQEQGRIRRLLSLLGFTPEDTGAQDAPAAATPRWLKAEPAVSADELARAFPLNLGYFWVGRNAGLALYFAPLVVALFVFLILGPRHAAGWLAALALVASALLYIRVIPDNWYGGSGAIGNRYIINAAPLALLLVPRGRELVVALLGGLAGLAFAGPLLGAPLERSLHGGRHTLLPQFRLAPIELTMLNDLTLFGEMGRKKQPVGDVGDELTHRPPDPRSYFLYFPDDGTYRRETAHGGTGFWLRGGESAQVILRAWKPVQKLRVTFVGGPEGDRVWFRVGACREAVALSPRMWRIFECGAGASVSYHGTALYVLGFRSTHGAVVEDPMKRSLGSFVLIDVEPR